MDDTINYAREHGYPYQTLMGRKRWLGISTLPTSPFVVLPNENAINSPIQGTAADMIKLAMIKHIKLLEKNFRSKMIRRCMMVVFDVYKDEVGSDSTGYSWNACSRLWNLPNGVPVIVEAGMEVTGWRRIEAVDRWPLVRKATFPYQPVNLLTCQLIAHMLGSKQKKLATRNPKPVTFKPVTVFMPQRSTHWCLHWKSAAFAKPILNHLHKLIHKVCPQGGRNHAKWSSFSITRWNDVCSMASQTTTLFLWFLWKASLMKDPVLLETAKSEVGHRAVLFRSKIFQTDKQLTAWIKEAMKLNDEVWRWRKKPVATKRNLCASRPDRSIEENKKHSPFWTISTQPGKEYIQWIEEAKREETRKKRIEQTVEWVAENKQRNWKYNNNLFSFHPP